MKQSVIGDDLIIEDAYGVKPPGQLKGLGFGEQIRTLGRYGAREGVEVPCQALCTSSTAFLSL